MNITRNLIVAVLMTVVTTVLLGVVYPLVVTGLAQAIFPDKANGQLIEQNGKVVGSRIIGQAFSSPGYFHSRPSAAGTGYDAANSARHNLGPTNKKLIDAVKAAVDGRAEGESRRRRCRSISSPRRRPGSTRTSRRRRRSSRCRGSRGSAASPRAMCAGSSRRTRTGGSSASSASRGSTSWSSISRSTTSTR